MAFQAADSAIQIHGGYGVCKEFPFEGFYREARMARLLYGREEELNRAVGENFVRGRVGVRRSREFGFPIRGRFPLKRFELFELLTDSEEREKHET